MNYKKARKGGKPSATQWNGFLDHHRRSYAGNTSNSPLPALLDKSVIASASLESSSADIEPYSPVRIVKQLNFDGASLEMPTYQVEAVDTSGSDKHGNYAFSLGEGITENGGRIVVSGIAIVSVEAGELKDNKASNGRDGEFDSSYYMVPDETLSSDLRAIAPVGHFRILSWYDVADLSSLADSDPVYIAIDMNQRPTSFLAKVDATIDATSEASEVITMSSGTAYAYYGVSASTAASGELEVQKDEDAYEIEVYNTSGEAIPSGEHLLSYSLEYNRFIVLVAGGQTVKIGKADADIAVGATGTISIWRNGSDTTENEDADLDWMAGSTQVSAGKEVMITWFADEGIWRITGAECED